GLGSDGTVGANKNSIKIIAEDGGFFGQAYFVYDSKKSGAMTASHLRFCKECSIRAPYLITTASFVACHHWPFIDRVDMLKYAAKNAVFLINAPMDKEKVWDELPIQVQQQIIDKNIKLYAIDAVDVAEKTGMGRRINTIMQVCFFAISGVLPRDEAIAQIKDSIRETYSRKGEEVIQSNFAAVDAALANLHEIKPGKADSKVNMLPGMPDNSGEFLRNVTGKIAEGLGDTLPVSAFLPVADGTWPTATTMYEKRCIAVSLPVWDEKLCIQCGKCAMVCPHATVRTKVAKNVDGAPAGFKSADYKGKEFPGYKYIVQIAPEDCTGCALCAEVCPAKDKANPKHKALDMEHVDIHLEKQRPNFDYFLSLPEVDRSKVNVDTIKGSQLLQPLFEFSGACAGCGETPYLKLATQLFGDRMVIANATGCSSIYGGNLPTTPFCKNPLGQGPVWANSLFEDNAEFGLGLRYSADFLYDQGRGLLKSLSGKIGDVLVKKLMDNPTKPLVDELRSKLKNVNSEEARRLSVIADNLIPRSVWIVGGDGWAYDIGYGGLDHILHCGRNVNILVMDTGVYSNTGGQQSKATPIGASAKFAIAGRELASKDLGAIAMVNQKVYVASVAFGASDTQTLKAFNEAESYNGVSLILAYSHCIAHGFDLSKGLDHQKLAVETGLWPLYRFDPRMKAQDKPLLQLDSKAPSRPVIEFLEKESRFRSVRDLDPKRFEMLMQKNQQEIYDRRKYYERIAGITTE
ncbi:MAG: pyruvate:ferredoxin (flavodoxin) oxidoreductase, partial [Alphaproteobacteria bacterium]|nr:pyruvate:ferredoxin (flavodoxin) oxidoreductase [Alphaproteobacteria bacterium]